MQTRNLLSVAFSLAMAGTALAADLPSRRAPPVFVPPPIPVFTWTGFYVGGQVGYEFGRTRVSFQTPNGAVLGPLQVGQTAAAIGGAHLGYNYQLGGLGGGPLGGGIVVGAEFDIEGSNNTSTQPIIGNPVIGIFAQHKGQIEGSARGRIGLAVDRALFYATGGAAFAQFKDTLVLNVGPAALNLGNFSTTRVGYTVGGGAEYAVTPAFSLRAEYRYTDFGSYNNATLIRGLTERNRVIEQKVQAGFSYHFADVIPAPVVARY